MSGFVIAVTRTSPSSTRLISEISLISFTLPLPIPGEAGRPLQRVTNFSSFFSARVVIGLDCKK